MYRRVREHVFRALVGFDVGIIFGGVVVRLGVSLDNGVQAEGGGEGEDERDVKDCDCELTTVTIYLGSAKRDTLRGQAIADDSNVDGVCSHG